MGMHDLPFESVIVRYPEAFSPEVVEGAKARLEEFKKIRANKTDHGSVAKKYYR